MSARNTLTPGTETLSYFLTDHLGSVVAVTDSSGALLEQQRYYPFGEVRTDVSAITQTDFGFTFQRDLDAQGNESTFGLMDYKARFYDAYLNHFIQPDSIISDLSDPQSLNRYSYVQNEPIGHSDPTGHAATVCSPGDACGGQYLYGPGGLQENEQKLAIIQAEADKRKCNAGSDIYCSTALKHPVETAAFTLVGLGIAGVAAAIIAPVAVSAQTVATTAATVETANIACGGDMCVSEVQDILARGERIITVIGRYPENQKLAEKIGGNWLDVPMRIWNSMTRSEQWARNVQWLQEAMIRGDVFRLASDISRAEPGTGFAQELNYLFAQGYTITFNGQYLIPPGPY